MTVYTFSIRVDQDRNVMYIAQSGRPSAEDFEELKDFFLDKANKLQRGFSIVNDQRKLEPFDDQAMAVAKELVALTNERGAARVVRIVPADLVSTTKLSRTLVSGKSRYRTTRVATPEEAEAVLGES